MYVCNEDKYRVEVEEREVVGKVALEPSDPCPKHVIIIIIGGGFLGLLMIVGAYDCEFWFSIFLARARCLQQ